MEESKDVKVTNDCQPEEKSGKNRRLSTFALDVARGFGMGVAFIIPGFSGGSVAAILGIYEKLIGAIADILKQFKKSVITLLPIFLGLVLGAVSLLFPLGWALEKFPLPTVSLFVGLAIGGLPSITDKIKGKPSATNIAAFALPFILAVCLSFLPTSADVDLLNLNFGGYMLLFLIGILGSSALVIPGISGSMLLLILGYYNPIINIITDHLLAGRDIGKSLLVLLSAGLGIAFGFIGISVIMKWLLQKYAKGTYFAIIGFIVGSIPTVYISTAKDTGLTLATLPTSALHWIACVLLLIFGLSMSLLLIIKTRKKKM